MDNLYRLLTAGAAQRDPRRCRRADLPAARDAALWTSRRICSKASSRCATCPRPGTRAWRTASKCARQCRRRLPAGHPLGARAPSAISRPMRSARVIAAQLWESLRARMPGSGRRSVARGDFTGVTRWLGDARARARRAADAAGTDEAGDRQAAAARRRRCAISKRKYLEEAPMNACRGGCASADALRHQAQAGGAPARAGRQGDRGLRDDRARAIA